MVLVVLFCVPKFINIKPYVVSSGSMIPKYQVGSLIYVKKIDPKYLKIGDPITFYMDDDKTVATHEIYKIDIENKLFYTQGINNKDNEGNIIHDAKPVGFSNLIGKPIFCIPYLGFINRIITTSPGINIIIVFTIIVILISYMLDKKQKIKE